RAGRAGETGNSLYFAYARRKPGVSLRQAQADVTRVAANVAATDPVTYAFHTAKIIGLHESVLTNLRVTLLTLLAGASVPLFTASEFVPHPDEISIDWRVLGFSVVVALATGVLAGLAPLWQAFHTAPNTVLTEGVRASASAPARRLSQVFVVGEIALAFTLL